MTEAGSDLVRSWGDVRIYLQASSEIISGRISGRPDTDSRIIFGPCKSIDKLLAYRHKRFEELATHTISTEQDPLHVLHDITHIITTTKKTSLQSTRSEEIQKDFRKAIFQAQPSEGLWYRDIM